MEGLAVRDGEVPTQSCLPAATVERGPPLLLWLPDPLMESVNTEDLLGPYFRAMHGQ